MTAKLAIHNKRMLQLMEYCIANEIEPNKKAFLHNIGFNNSNNLTKVLSGELSFTIDQLALARAKYNIDSEYFFKEKNPPMFRNKNARKPIEYLKEAVKLVEIELNKNR